MPGIDTLVDDFNDNTVNPTLWPDSYGTYQEAGGRARVSCDTGFNAYKSAATYTLTGSGFYLRVYAPAAAGAATSTCTAFITTTTAGTDAGFLIDTAGTAMGCYLRSGFADPGAVFLTYSATDHAWLRLRETAGTLYWDTSPDGTTWTNRRTATTPSWASDTTLALYMDSHRDTGTSNWAEYDNLNTPPVTTQPFGTATETSATPAPAGRKTSTAGTTAELDMPIALAARKQAPVGTATEGGTVLAPAGRKTRVAGASTETSTALSIVGAKTTLHGAATETSSTQPQAGIKQSPAGAAIEASTAPTPAARKQAAAGRAQETSTTLGGTTVKRRPHGTATETNTAIGILQPGLGHITAAAPRTSRWTAATPRSRWATR